MNELPKKKPENRLKETLKDGKKSARDRIIVSDFCNNYVWEKLKIIGGFQIARSCLRNFKQFSCE